MALSSGLSNLRRSNTSSKPKFMSLNSGWGWKQWVTGSTLTAGVAANCEGISWATKEKIQQANWVPDDIVFGGWDISDMNLTDSMTRAKVLDIDLHKQLRPYMENIVPLPSIYDPDFIAANQDSRVNHVIKGTKKQQMEQRASHQGHPVNKRSSLSSSQHRPASTSSLSSSSYSLSMQLWPRWLGFW